MRPQTLLIRHVLFREWASSRILALVYRRKHYALAFLKHRRLTDTVTRRSDALDRPLWTGDNIEPRGLARSRGPGLTTQLAALEAGCSVRSRSRATAKGER